MAQGGTIRLGPTPGTTYDRKTNSERKDSDDLREGAGIVSAVLGIDRVCKLLAKFGLVVLLVWLPLKTLSAQTAYDEADHLRRLRQAAAAVVASEEDVKRLQQELDSEKRRVLKTDVDREINRDTIGRLERDIATAQGQLGERQGALIALKKAAESVPRPPKVEAPPPPPAAPLQSRDNAFPGMSDQDVCRTALTASGWDPRPDFARYRQEAERRGYTASTCRDVAVGRGGPPLSGPTNRPQAGPSSVPGMNDHDVCKTALDSRLRQWDARAQFANFRQEAERRGYSAEDCLRIVGRR
jgi:hypothetical protein